MISIIIVNYKVKKELFNSISSIYRSKPRSAFEIIVVDNDEKKTIGNDLKKKFPKVTYIESPENKGFGAGNNFGARHAKGEYLFFLNPDTIVKKDAIDNLITFIKENKKTGIAAPLLLNENEKPFELQGEEELTPLNGIVALSFLNKIFSNNSISKKFWLSNWNKKSNREVATVPGTAFMIKKELFEKVMGFDEKFFLYFEETDLCKRVRSLGLKLFIVEKAKIIHLWERSTSKRTDIKKIFNKSKKYYFRKHYGLVWSAIVDFFTNIGKNKAILYLILILSIFLRFYQLSDTMVFFGDIGWFYLSAKDLILGNNFPLVGITSSHIWLHQGPYWTYILSAMLYIFNFNPAAGSYFTSTLGVFTVYLVYKLGSSLFSERMGLISAFLYAVSPLVIIHARMPYHTSPIPFFLLLLIWSFYYWLKGRKIYFYAVFALMFILYNFEIATQSLWAIVIIFFLYGLFKKEKYVLNLLNKKTLILCAAIFLIIMLPVLVYDFQNGFPQTFKFYFLWIPYKILNPVLHFKQNTNEGSLILAIITLFDYYKRLILNYSLFGSGIIFVFTIYILAFSLKTYKNIKSILFSETFLLIIFALVPLLGILFAGVVSEAYLPVLFPTIILLTGFSFDYLFKFNKTKLLVIVLVLAIGILNIYSFFKKNNYYTYFPTIKQRYLSAEKIVNEANGKKYNLVGRGLGSEFRSFTMNTEYLTFILGNSPSEKKQDLVFYISEAEGKIRVIENKENKIIKEFIF